MVEWIDKKERMPGVKDADEWGCVFIWDKYNGIRITGWRNAWELNRPFVTHWARTVPGPDTSATEGRPDADIQAREAN